MGLEVDLPWLALQLKWSFITFHVSNISEV